MSLTADAEPRPSFRRQGRNGYQDLANVTDLNLLNSPELVNEPGERFRMRRGKVRSLSRHVRIRDG